MNGQWTYAGLAVLVAIVWFATLSARPLFNPDEGRYAEIPREMLADGDWVIPHLNGLAYVEKPPLQYWASALALRLFGQGEFAVRFYTALCAVGTLVVVWLTGRRWNIAAAWQSAAVLASMVLFIVLGQLLTLDMSLTWYLTLALAGFIRAQLVGAGGSAAADPLVAQATERRWMLLAWVAIALGVMTKGLVAAVIPAAVLVLYSGYTRDRSPWRRLHAAFGLPAFLLITVPWHWLAARRMPDFLQFFFVHEHFARYLTPSAHREQPGWFFAAVFLLGSAPWTVPAVRVVATGWRRRGPPHAGFDPEVFLWLWVVFVCGFFSLSDSKLAPYILPALPALALLIGISSAQALRRDLRITAMVTIVAAIGLAAGSLYGPRMIAAMPRSAYFSLLARPLSLMAVLLALSGLYAILPRRRDTSHATVFLGVGWCLAGLILMRAAASLAPVYSGITLARAVSSLPPDEPLYSVGTYDQTLPFYWARTFKLVAYRGELDFGLLHDPAAEIPSIDQFLLEWQGTRSAYAVMEPRMFDDLERRGVAMREIVRDVHRVLVARR